MKDSAVSVKIGDGALGVEARWGGSRLSMPVRLLLGVVGTLLLALPSPGELTNFIDTLDGATLDARWTRDDQPGSYDTGGGAVMNGTMLRLNSVFANAYAHIQTPLGAASGFRADAVMRQDHYPVATWGMSLTVYYDANNWIAIRQGAAGGQNGWLRDVMDNGNITEVVGTTVSSLRVFFAISGIEITGSQIYCYGSTISPQMDQSGQTNIEANSALIPEFTMARPAGFTGNALLIVGKGTTQSGYPNPDFDNNAGSLGSSAFAGIDYVRVKVLPKKGTVVLFR
jgi:hypothetical protein